MLLVCPHCGARYRIDRERLAAQGARARCVRCGRMFLVGAPRDAAFMPTSPRDAAGEAPPARATATDVGPDPFASIDDREPERRRVSAGRPERWQPPVIDRADAMPAREAAAEPDDLAPSSPAGGLQVVDGGGRQGVPHRVSMRVVRGGQQPSSADDDRDAEDGAGLELSVESATRLAEELVAALAATYPARLAKARADGQWTFHLGDVIDDARADFHRAIGSGLTDGDRLFDVALEALLRGDDATDASMGGGPGLT